MYVCRWLACVDWQRRGKCTAIPWTLQTLLVLSRAPVVAAHGSCALYAVTRPSRPCQCLAQLLGPQLLPASRSRSAFSGLAPACGGAPRCEAAGCFVVALPGCTDGRRPHQCATNIPNGGPKGRGPYEVPLGGNTPAGMLERRRDLVSVCCSQV